MSGIQNPAASPPVDPGVCEGRLTLTTAVPVTTADVTGATSIYFTPYNGNRISLYDGTSAWVNLAFTEKTLALGTLTNDLPYDVFAYNNSGVVALELLAWTSKTARATALVLQDGVLVKTGATTRRYLGSFHTTSTTTTEDSALKRLVFNYHHRVRKPLRVIDATANWTYSGSAWQQARASAANQVAVVVGVAEVDLGLSAAHNSSNSVGGTACGIGTAVGEDGIVPMATCLIVANTMMDATARTYVSAQVNHRPAVGYHYYTWLERASTTGVTTLEGFTSTFFQSGLSGSIEG